MSASSRRRPDHAVRWLWIDRIVSLDPGQSLVAVKNVSYAEEHLQQHFAPCPGLAAMPVMPGSLVIEGMAQTAGILVGHASAFEEKVVLAKITRAELHADASPGCTLRYTARITQRTAQGAATEGMVELRQPDAAEFDSIGAINLVFSHLDRNAAGTEYPEHNFVFGDTFRDILRNSGVDPDTVQPLPLD